MTEDVHQSLSEMRQIYRWFGGISAAKNAISSLDCPSIYIIPTLYMTLVQCWLCTKCHLPCCLLHVEALHLVSKGACRTLNVIVDTRTRRISTPLYASIQSLARFLNPFPKSLDTSLSEM